MPKQPEESIYVNIAHPQDTRKALLESAKATIKLIQLNDSIRSIRMKKKELLIKLENELTEIVSSFSKLKSYYPKVKMSDLPKTSTVKTESLLRKSESLNEPAMPVQNFQKREQLSPGPARVRPEDKLEVQLRGIEEKLRDLNV